MKKYGYYDKKEPILKRLTRAEGQVRGVARMVQADKYCVDILTQINAAQAALDKVAVELLREHAKHCMALTPSAKDHEEKVDELVGAVHRMLSR